MRGLSRRWLLGALALPCLISFDPAKASGPDIFMSIEAGQVFLTVNGNKSQFTAGNLYTYSSIATSGDQIVIQRSDGFKIQLFKPGTISALDPAVRELIYSDLGGQSNAAANRAVPVYHSAAPYPSRYLTFNAGQRAFGDALGNDQEKTTAQLPVYLAIEDLVPGYECQMGGAGETANTEYAIQRIKKGLPTDAALITTCSAIGSARAQALIKRATEGLNNQNLLGAPWRNIEIKAWRAAFLARVYGYVFRLGPLRWNQGEGNIADTASDYGAYPYALQADWEALALSLNAMPEKGRPQLILTQTCTGGHYNLPRSAIPTAQLRPALLDPSRFLCGGPMYDQPYADDGAHLLTPGQIMQGARQAEMETYQVAPLHVKNWTISKKVARLFIANPFGNPLEFDRAGIKGLDEAQGFSWHDAGDDNKVAVTHAEIVNKNTVDLTLTAKPAGTQGAIDIAMNGILGADGGPSTGNRSTLRTLGSGASTSDGRKIYHYVCIDSVLGPA